MVTFLEFEGKRKNGVNKGRKLSQNWHAFRERGTNSILGKEKVDCHGNPSMAGHHRKEALSPSSYLKQTDKQTNKKPESGKEGQFFVSSGIEEEKEEVSDREI
ncbi:hypothetical protein QQP08_008466 [Theobroma cacao]|nr:hypothetical protein QQP08_008466 [Theobroma cacao]